MNPEVLFSMANMLVLPGWILLVFAPRWKWTERLISTLLIPLLLACLYSLLIVFYFGRASGGFGSLEQVGQLFQNPYLLLAGWVHYLSFDLLVGGWELRDAHRTGIHHFLVVPCLALTFLFGPAGLLLYCIVRRISTGVKAGKDGLGDASPAS